VRYGTTAPTFVGALSSREAELYCARPWIPAFAGMTMGRGIVDCLRCANIRSTARSASSQPLRLSNGTGRVDSNHSIRTRSLLPTQDRRAARRMEANVNISQSLVRPNDERGFYQTLGQYATFLFNASHDIMKTTGYMGVQVSVQGKTINVYDGTQTQSAAKTINPWDLIGQPIWTGPQTAQWRTVMRGDFQVSDMVTLPKSLATLTASGSIASGQGINIIQGSFMIQGIRHVGNFGNPDGSAWCSVFDGTQPISGSGSSTAITNAATPSGRAVGPV
jgi:hypothetical protein